MLRALALPCFPVSFLDDLKRQASVRREQNDKDEAALDERVECTEDACRLALRYLTQLADQLEVLRPVSTARYQLDRQHVFEGLPMSDFYADARRKPLRRTDGLDHMVLHWQLKGGPALDLVKNFPNDIEQLEARLRQAAIKCDPHVVRDPDNGKLIETRFKFEPDFRAGVKLTPDHENAVIHVHLQNLERLESLAFHLPADAVDEARLDELARWLTGAPHRFLDGALGLRRIGG